MRRAGTPCAAGAGKVANWYKLHGKTKPRIVQAHDALSDIVSEDSSQESPEEGAPAATWAASAFQPEGVAQKTVLSAGTEQDIEAQVEDSKQEEAPEIKHQAAAALYGQAKAFRI
ncbi:MAG: hypothetical protein AB3N11_03195 [Arenibacterium sp.]